MPRATKTAAKPAKSAAKGAATTTKAAKTAKTAKKADGAVKAVKAAAEKATKKSATKKATTTNQVTTSKATATKSTKPAAKKGGGGDKFFEAQRKALLEERETYTRQAHSLRAEAEALAEDMEPGDVQFDEESGEGDTINVERERDLQLSAQALQSVDEIDRALAKIDDGSYGICEQCNEQIPKERLKALPYAALCVRCKSAGLSTRR